ncbi:MAG: molybdopterin-dependent oxidoreductase, partial [Elusimicrobia bacterium]|nr:molybdopterin-dependent oxidoreductase [Elusimicrobiota bacterium]
VRKALAKMFPRHEVRVVQAATGGAFGGKEDYPSLLAGHAALLALKAGRPVKMIYGRQEDMAATTKRHPALVRHRTGFSREGRLTAQDIELVMDGGAYLTCSSVVLSRGTLHATGPYECPNVRVRASAVATNTPPNGAFRGFGVPQAIFAAELQMEKAARALGLDGVELRRRNAWRPGTVTATGQKLKESVGARACLDLCAAKSGYGRKRRANAAWNARAKKPTWRGMGLALCHHGAGFTGSGEVALASRAALRLGRDGSITVLAASTELGQGARTVFAQIAAQVLGLPRQRIRVAEADTALVPDSGPTVASRTTMVIGRLVERAAHALKADLLAAGGRVPAGPAALRRAAGRICGARPEKIYEKEFEKPPDVTWDDARYRGEAYGAFSYAAAAVELEVDKLTYEVRVTKVTTAQDIGKAVNPRLAEGQIMGGTAQALGYALMEAVDYRDGWMRNARLSDYIVPTALDAPPMEIHLVEEPYSRGPFGAKGLGEMPMDVPAPAVVCALRDALGVWFDELPVLPERIFRELNVRERPR